MLWVASKQRGGSSTPPPGAYSSRPTPTEKRRTTLERGFPSTAPTKDFHEYRFDFYPGRADFYVDGELMHSFDEGLPEDPMHLYINTWFPTWLSGERPETDRYTYVDWLRH